ncbi:hypothetical protein CLOP_g15865 [Closterium sp. NIES-67]|nr:hypothetical protein CLOP_g11750 [Closterium sp. NIES-67]GJP85766.1 hypothetical protein CLOP_g15865 [Closterium sp. NIES-67]
MVAEVTVAGWMSTRGLTLTGAIPSCTARHGRSTALASSAAGAVRRFAVLGRQRTLKTTAVVASFGAPQKWRFTVLGKQKTKTRQTTQATTVASCSEAVCARFGFGGRGGGLDAFAYGRAMRRSLAEPVIRRRAIAGSGRPARLRFELVGPPSTALPRLDVKACDGDDSDDVDTSAFCGGSSGNGALFRMAGSGAATADVSLADSLDELGGGGPEERFGVNGRRVKFKVGGSEEASSEVLGAAAKEMEKGVEAVGSAALKTRKEERADLTEEEAKRKRRLSHGRIISALLFVALLATLLLVDSYIWRLIRRPLAAFFLTIPFLVAAATSAYAGAIAIPFLGSLKAQQVLRVEGPATHAVKAGTPTMGGLFFVPLGVIVARVATGNPPELAGVAGATLALMGVGAVDDGLSLAKKHNYGLPGIAKLGLQVAVGTALSYWLHGANLQSPYSMKNLVPLPQPFGLWYIGRWYVPLTVFCMAAMSNAVNLTDGLDGLAAGTTAVAFVAMAIACLPIYPAMGAFGAAMAGACVGFLAHNRHKASVFMGDTGSLALGAALAAMAATTGLFLPLFIASSVFVLETVSVSLQVFFFQLTKRLTGTGRRIFRMAPFHHHLELSGMVETTVVMLAYIAAFVAGAAAVWVAIISV